MKFIFVAVALSCLSFVVTKPLDDVDRKCIVKYLSDKELLDSSFVVDPVLPDNCDQLISSKIFDIYFDIIYDEILPEEYEYDWSEVGSIFQRNGVADVVLKSLLYDDGSKEAKDLQETIKQMRTIADLFDSWKNYKLNENVKTLQIKSPDSATELCLKNHVTSEIFPNYVETKNSEQFEKYDINGFECDKLITSFQTDLEVHLLDKLPKSSTDEENICMKNVYVNSNMTQKFSDVFIFSMMKEINMDDTYRLYKSYCYQVAAYYEMTMECTRLGFVLKDVPEVRNVYSIDFTRDGSLFSTNYIENFGILVKFNTNRSLNEIQIIADEMSQVKNNSQCLIDHLNNFELSKMSLKLMEAENIYEVDRITAMKKIMKEIFKPIKDSCKQNNDISEMFREFQTTEEETSDTMNCFQEFVTEEKVNGITYFRVNMDGQLNDKKCEIVVYHLEHMEKSIEEICLRRASKNLNLFKMILQIKVFAELGISNQQIEEEKINFKDLKLKIMELHFKCQKEAFDLI